MNKRLIRLTEQDIHRIVKESVNRILMESILNSRGAGAYDGYERTPLADANKVGRITTGPRDSGIGVSQDVIDRENRKKAIEKIKWTLSGTLGRFGDFNVFENADGGITVSLSRSILDGDITKRQQRKEYLYRLMRNEGYEFDNCGYDNNNGEMWFDFAK